MKVFEHLAICVAFCFWTGCALQPTDISKKGGPESATEKSSHKSKVVVPADQVPDKVKRALTVKFPKITVAEWKLKPLKIYEAEFTFDAREITVMFDSDGKWLETESAVDPAQVPRTVNEAAARYFKGYKMIETQDVRQWDNPHILYEIHLENRNQIAKVLFSADGKILKQSAKNKLP